MIGDDDFDSFVAVNWPSVVRFAYRLTLDVAAAEDLSQDAFTRIWRRWDSIDHAKALAYARRSVVNNFITEKRRRERFDRLKSTLARRETSAPDTAVVERDSLRAALGQLTANQRTAVVLRYVEDLPVDEVAYVTGWSSGTVKTHASRGLAHLRDWLAFDEAAPAQGDNHGQQ
ncbi:SigE family RNA polymerase sigma factor [Solicola gregarius]|uniref:SigE family RNA polymerase sigma factor n=1 Tax=Solicola gregarius TaxID=2908642 RepID=A0AA46YMH2_9ACTN|nr:SigE family RNA polymerase sigma factor [Solicola gregarius]UYM06521.1 SigE family RNA polymerase sigma factor [Solicola gregarius]